ncbi:MAG: DUF2442 domain-containing protein [Alphaproteobacteria bacterium]|nr:MAG: DUF2442 domain-containing protein [Alphaproteobacteria bacterium]
MSDDIIQVGAPLPRIAEAVALAERQVRITWATGEAVTLDLAPVLHSRRVYRPLREDDALFRSVRVSQYGNAIEWSDELDLSAVWLARLPSISFGNADFRRAMDTLGMTLDGMAEALEVSRRRVAGWRKDQPIPRHIGLATRYLVEHQGKA